MTDATEPNEIERDLAQTRARLDATIDALQQKLSPNEVVDQAISYLKESGGGEFGRNLVLTMRDHPIPVALIGIGVAWLMITTNRRPAGDGRVRVYDEGQALERYEEARERYRDETRSDLALESEAIREESRTDLGLKPEIGGYDRPAAAPQAGNRAGDARYYPSPETPRYPARERWEDNYLSQHGAYASAAYEDLATKANEAGSSVRRAPNETEDAYQDRVYAAKGEVLGLRRDEDETSSGFRQRIEAAVTAAAERYERLREQAMTMGQNAAHGGRTLMQNIADYGRQAAEGAYDYGRQAAETAYDYGQAAWEGGSDLGRGVARSMRDHPLPYALVGAGIAWFLWSSWGGGRQGSRYDTGRYGRGGYGRNEGAGYGHGPGYGRGGDYGRGSAGYGRSAGYGAAGAGYGRGAGGYGQAGQSMDDLATRAHEAGARVQRGTDESEDAYQERVYGARGTVMGLVKEAGETLSAFRERVDAALASAAEQYRRWRDQASSAGSDMAARGQGMAQSAYDYGRQAAGTAYDYGQSAIGGARAAGGRTLSYLQDQPLLLGAIGITIGAVLAMLVPPSRYEREIVGGVRGDVRERVREVASDAMEGAGRVAREMMGAARDSVEQEHLGDFGVGGMAAAARDKVHQAAERVRHVVEETAAAGREAVERELGVGEQSQGGNGKGSDQGRHETGASTGNLGGSTGHDTSSAATGGGTSTGSSTSGGSSASTAGSGGSTGGSGSAGSSGTTRT